MERASRREIGKGWVFAVAMIVAALALSDMVFLRGEHVDSVSVSLGDSDGGRLEIARTGEEHRVEISTRRRVRGETRGEAIHVRLVGPDGSPVLEDTELVARKTRTYDFVPTRAGTYWIYVDDARSLLGTGRGRARVTVTVNDRRILAPLLGW